MPIEGERYEEVWRYIYFIQRLDTKDIKIGMSKDPVQRFIQLQAQYNTFPLRLLGILPNQVHFDKYTHRSFAHLHIDGEWFLPGPDLLLYIDIHATFDGLDMDRYHHELTIPPKRICFWCGKALLRHCMIVDKNPITGQTGIFHRYCIDRLYDAAYFYDQVYYLSNYLTPAPGG